MLTKKSLVAVLTLSTVLTSGAAFAQSPSASPQPGTQQQQAAEKDFGKLSKDGSKAFQDLALTRLAIFDGRTDDAKKYAGEADTSFAKAKTDETVFTKSEAELNTPQPATGEQAGGSGQAANGPAANNQNASAATSAASAGQSANAKTPIAWLPVDGEISIADTYTGDQKKAAAVADANKSLAKGDRKGALDKLTLADVDLAVILAVVPVQQTVSDVHQAVELIDGGKYYEASQLLRKVQDSARFDVANIVGTPKAVQTDGAAPAPKASASGTAATH